MDVLDDVRAFVEAQLRTLDQEEQRLRRALDKLGDPGGRKPRQQPDTPISRPRREVRKASAKRVSKGVRRDQFMQCIADAGGEGITVATIAKEIGLSTPNSLHPVGKSLLKMGAVSKEGSRYYPVGVKPPAGRAKASKANSGKR